MKIERRYMAHYLNAGFGGAENYCRLGADLEEYSPELTANVEKKSNILGQTSVTIDGYQKQGEVSPYYAETADTTYPAVREECYIEVVSYGGDTTGYQIPFNVHYTGVKVKGKFDVKAKKFVAD